MTLACCALFACGGGDIGFSDGPAGVGGAASVAVSSSSSASGSGGNAAGGFGGMGAGGDSSGGFGGEGGSGGEYIPLCPAPSCPSAGDADHVINCDPVCGALSPECSNVCGASMPIPIGTTIIRTPPILEQSPYCKSLCGEDGPLWAMGFDGPVDVPGCISGDGPDGGISGGASGPNSIDQCHQNASQCVATSQSVSDTLRAWVSVLSPSVSGEPLPDTGATFRIRISEASCQPVSLKCLGGCNGQGGEISL